MGALGGVGLKMYAEEYGGREGKGGAIGIVSALVRLRLLKGNTRQL